MKSLFILLSALLAFASFGANAQNTPWTYGEEEDGFGIKTYSLVVAGAEEGFDFRFALSMGCSSGKNHFFVQHSFRDSEFSSREESLRHILKLSDRVYSVARRSAETGEMAWRVDDKSPKSITIDFAKFSDGPVGVASKHLPSFLRAIYAGKVMIIGYTNGSIVHQFSLVGTKEKVAKFAKNCNIGID